MGRICAPIVALMLAAACGSPAAASYEQTHSAQQIVTDASKSTGSANSFHINVDADTSQGRATADLDVEGSNLKGTVTGQGLQVRITHVDGKTYVFGADLMAVLLKTDPQAAAVVQAKAINKWVLMPAEFWDSTGLSAITDVHKLTDCLQASSGLNKKGTSNVLAMRVVEVDNQAASKLFVATSGPHYFARMALQSGDKCIPDSNASSETIDLTKVGTKLGITAPADSVDLQTLAG